MLMGSGSTLGCCCFTIKYITYYIYIKDLGLLLLKVKELKMDQIIIIIIVYHLLSMLCTGWTILCTFVQYLMAMAIATLHFEYDLCCGC